MSVNQKRYYPVKVGEFFNNRYYVVCKLGKGSSSTVHLCWDLESKQFVAVKVMRNELGYTKMAKDEIKILKHIRDNNLDDPRRNKIVQLLDNFVISGSTGTHICMVLEVMGDNLLQFTEMSQNRRIPLTNIKNIMKQILQGLDFLHTKCKIIHTDIKPENILICTSDSQLRGFCWEMQRSLIKTKNKEMRKLLEKHLQEVNFNQSNETNSVYDVSVKIADLGNACWVDEHFTDFITTCHYRSPEVILGADYCTSTDIWSLGCIAFELSVGTLLFNPNAGEDYSEEEDHLACMIELFGKIPKHVALSGKKSRKYFNVKGKLRRIQIEPCGLFEVLTGRFDLDRNEAKQFVDFLLPMFKFGTDKRASALDCINHPWIVEQESVNEEISNGKI